MCVVSRAVAEASGPGAFNLIVSPEAVTWLLVQKVALGHPQQKRPDRRAASKERIDDTSAKGDQLRGQRSGRTMEDRMGGVDGAGGKMLGDRAG